MQARVAAGCTVPRPVGDRVRDRSMDREGLPCEGGAVRCLYGQYTCEALLYSLSDSYPGILEFGLKA